MKTYLVCAALLILVNFGAALEKTIIELPGPGLLQKPAGYVPHENPYRPTVALALSGGGTRGLAHIGVLRAFSDYHLPIDAIAGTSIGAVIGGLYAAGYSLSDLETLAGSYNWNDLFLDKAPRRTLPLSSKSAESSALLEIQFTHGKPYIPPALSAGQNLSTLLVDMVNRATYRADPDFDHLPIRFASVSVDMRDGKRVVFRSGDLAEAMLASMALPLLIAPLKHGDMLLIDGGVAENIPTRTAKEFGDSLLVAVDMTKPPYLGNPPYEPWVIANQVTTLMHHELNCDLLAAASVVISPAADSTISPAPQSAGQLIQMGYAAAVAKIPDIQALLSRRSWDGDTALVPVNQALFNGLDAVADLRERIGNQSKVLGALHTGRPPQRREVLSDLEAMQRDGRVQRAWAEFHEDTLVLVAQLNPVPHSVDLHGVTQLNVSILLDRLRQDTGRVIDAAASADRLKEILNAYRRLGNPLARIDSVRLEENGRLSIFVNEGAIQSLNTLGQRNLSPKRILRDFHLRVGKPLNLKALNRGLAELYGSGLFNIVRATVVDGQVTIKVSESPPPRLRIGAGFDSERHGRGFAQLSYANIPRFNGKLMALAKYAEFEERYCLTYNNPAFFQTYLEGSGSFEYQQTERYYYDAGGKSDGLYYVNHAGGSIYFGQQFRTWGRVVLGLKADRVRTNYDQSPSELDLRRIFLRSEVDTQDRVEFPSSGFRSLLEAESALSTLGGDVSFNSFTANLAAAYSLTRRLAILGSFQGGVCDETTPFSEWFRLGGEKSFLGLHEAELAGRRLSSLHLEVREDLLSRFLADAYVSIGLDYGAAWPSLQSDISTSDFMTGAALSFALDTVLGPISLTYGHLFPKNLFPQRNALYFNIGHRF